MIHPEVYSTLTTQGAIYKYFVMDFSVVFCSCHFVVMTLTLKVVAMMKDIGYNIPSIKLNVFIRNLSVNVT
jgi:hypothetical protein